MRHVTRRLSRNIGALALFTLSFSLVGLSVDTAEAARPNLFSRLLQHRRSVSQNYQQRYTYANWRYPKYTGAFHASYFQSIGVPSGDIGFRGNGLYVTPW